MDRRFVLSLVFAVIVAVFAIQNAETVDVRFLSWSLQISQALVILISAIFGAIVVLLLGIVRWVRMKSKIWKLSKTISTLEAENRALKQIREDEQEKPPETQQNVSDNAESAEDSADRKWHENVES